MLDREIIFVSDTVKDHNNATLYTRDLEKPNEHYYLAVRNAIQTISKQVICYHSPEDFLDHIAHHRNSVVLSLWSGEASRNRRALVPSICEAYKLPYVGADSYVQTICADKHLCKDICKRFNIKSASDITVSSDHDLIKLKSLHYPAVVKPNFEGGSIGILASSLIDNEESAKRLCLDLLGMYPQLIVEEYIPGYEVSVCLAGISGNVDIMQTVKVSIDNQDYFEHSIVSAEAKKMGKTTNKRDIANELLRPVEYELFRNLYVNLGKVDLMRIDGRVNQDGFYMIELTPDCSLSPKGSMSTAFQASGFSYERMFEYLLSNAIRYHEAVYKNAST